MNLPDSYRHSSCKPTCGSTKQVTNFAKKPLNWQKQTAMTVKMDKFGRILIPKKVREAFGIEAGQSLQLEVDEYAGKLEFSPIKDRGLNRIVITECGLPIIKNGPPSDDSFDTVTFIKETREQYLDRKMGLK